MTGMPGTWGATSRFYLPNEDARVVCAALRLAGGRVLRPVFVGGSGMVLLEAASGLSGLERATYVDIAPFQADYFRSLLAAIERSGTAHLLQLWFTQEVYPRLREHFRGRGRNYGLDQVMDALRELFGISFFFNPESLGRARRTARRTEVVTGDIAAYLARPGSGHDFVYLSNVTDYLDFDAQCVLFAACRKLEAPVYALVTSACGDRAALERAWESAGYLAHPRSPELDAMNRGLGAPDLDRVWNRPGSARLLTPQKKGDS